MQDMKLVDLYRGISDFKKAYQPRTKIVKDGKGDLITDSHSILPRRRKHFSQLLNIRVYGINDVRQREIHTAQPYCLTRVSLRLKWLFKS